MSGEYFSLHLLLNSDNFVIYVFFVTPHKTIAYLRTIQTPVLTTTSAQSTKASKHLGFQGFLIRATLVLFKNSYHVQLFSISLSVVLPSAKLLSLNHQHNANGGFTNNESTISKSSGISVCCATLFSRLAVHLQQV